MTVSTTSSSSNAPVAVAGALDRPGLRTFRSPAFRVIVAFTVWSLAAAVLALALLKQASDPAGQYAFDFQAYHMAATDIAAGRSPYAPEMFVGPIPAQGAILYKYPPLLAQVLLPIAGASFPAAASVWLTAQAALVLAGVWIAARAGGAPRTIETFAWCGAASSVFLPVFDTLWKGNVSGVLTFFVAVGLLGGTPGGWGTAAATLLKTTPVVMLPAAVSAGRRAVIGLLGAASVVGISVLGSPQAWSDFVRVLPNLVSGPARFPTNLAPDNLVALTLPTVPIAAEVARWTTLSVGILAIVLSVLVARRGDGWAAAVALGVTAYLLLPSATWYHYLAVLLPLAAFAWPRAATSARLALFCGGAAVSAALLALPLALLGAVAIVGAVLTVTWPRRPEARA